MKRLLVLASCALPAATLAGDYLGILKPAASSLATSGLYSFASAPSFTSTPAFAPSPTAETPYRLKLGYKYSRYLAIEGEVLDFLRPSEPFASPTSLASAFRGAGFGVDTVATLPLWRFSFYGRLGAYHGDRSGLSPYSTALLPDAAMRGTRWRYGLGMRYDFTRSLGVRAELERYSAGGLGSPLAGDGDADQFSVGVSWRF